MTDERKELELYGAKWLKKVSRLLVGNSVQFTTLFAKNIFRSELTVRRYFIKLPVPYLLDDYNLFYTAIKATLDCCSVSKELNFELIEKNRAKFEQTLFDELDDLHLKAVRWESPDIGGIV